MENNGVALPYHRAYRPVSISEYTGNEKIKKSAMRALKGGKRPQVILMQGHAGCGATLGSISK